jgi:hypothetical protein
LKKRSWLFKKLEWSGRYNVLNILDIKKFGSFVKRKIRIRRFNLKIKIIIG